MKDLKSEFINNFVCQFLASWAALNYEDACLSGEHDAMIKNAPAGDAKFIASKIWEEHLDND